MDQPWFYVAWTAGAYLLGSVSVGDLVSRAAGVSIRTRGTGNPGAANIYREIGPAHGVAVFALDVAKGGAATLPLLLLGLPLGPTALAAAAVLAGHFFPVPWRSIGGTGMAVGMGTTLGLLPLGALAAALPAVVVVVVTRNAGVTGALFFVATMAAGWLLHREPLGLIGVLLVGAAVLLKALLQYRGR